ncbi:MAG: MarR family transcriptional regulator [Thermoleophilaceae bacterium]|jgi:DNA-binding MarR family transcriptional regulator|nr:MarR family transcriptional regulator [Thermoleophilaceae bacterium]
MGQSQGAGEAEALAIMRLLHAMDAASNGRSAMELDLRQRRLVQVLGLAGPLPIAAAGGRLGVSPSTMTGLADRLEQQGYLARRPHPTDRRATVLELTAKGRRLFEREKDFYSRLIDETLAPLGRSERKLVLDALGHLEPADGAS